MGMQDMVQSKIKHKILTLIKSSNFDFSNNAFRLLMFSSQSERRYIFKELNTPNSQLRSRFAASLYANELSHFNHKKLVYNPKILDNAAIEYACFLICFFKEKIELYVRLRNEYEKMYLHKNYDSALEILNRIDQDVSISLWSCEQRLLQKELKLGLEGNKRELSEMTNQIPRNNLARTILYYYSSLAETNLSYENYQLEVSKFLKKNETTLDGQYLANKLSLQSESQYQNISLVLQVDSQFSIIDVFNSLEKFIPAFYENEICAGTLKIQNLFPCKLDCTIFHNLQLLLPSSGNPQSQNLLDKKAMYDIIETYTVGNYEKTLELAAQYLENHPSDFQIAAIFCKALLSCNIPFPDTIEIVYIKNIYSIYCMDNNYRDSILSLKQEIKKNHGLILGAKIQSFMFRKHLITGLTKGIFVSSFLDVSLHPNFSRYLTSQNLEEFETTLSEICPISIFFAAAKQNGIFDLEKLSRVPKEKVIIAKAEFLCRTNNFDEAENTIKSLDPTLSTHTPYSNERTNRIRLSIFHGKKNHSSAVTLLVEIYFYNIHLFERLNQSKCYILPKQPRDANLEKNICYPIYVYLMDPSNYSNQIIAYNNYLDRNNYPNILFVLNRIDIANSTLNEFFLNKVCSIGLLKRDFTLCSLKLTPENARMQILSKLISIHPSKEYLQEYNAVSTAEVLKENLKTINQSRIFVDTEKIYISHKDQWEETFRKYLSIKRFDTMLFGLDLEQLEIDTSSGPHQLRIITPQRVSQAALVFEGLIDQIIDACLFNTHYGLETYLSSRIRHGYCKGQLTTFLSEQHLISMRGNQDSSDYSINDFWDEKIRNFPNVYAVVKNALSEFTQKIESKIEEILKSWLRIKHKEHNEGMFDYTSLCVYCVEQYIDEQFIDFSAFYSKIVGEFWVFTTKALNSIQTRIDGELTQFYLESIDKLENQLQPFRTSAPPIQDFLSSCRLAKAKVTMAMKQFAEVFCLNDTHYNNFSMQTLTTSCKRAVEKIHNNTTKVNWIITADNTFIFDGKYFSPFVDVLCILLSNAIEHSGIEKHEILEIAVNINELQGDDVDEFFKITKAVDSSCIFQVSVTNTLGKKVNKQALEIKLENLFAEISNQNDEREHIQSEGGSGLYKLCNTSYSNIDTRSYISCEVKEKDITFNYYFVADNLLVKEDLHETSSC